MSESKRKPARSLQQIHDEIKENLLTTKPQLDDPAPPTRPSLTDDLNQIAALAESFSEQRPRSNSTNWIHLADTLDQEGVNLWNISGLIRKTPEDDGRLLVAALRFAALRLIEAGLETKPGIESLLHVLQLASKTGATLSEVGRHDVAARVLTSAAKYEELLRNVDDPDGAQSNAIACGAVVYFSSRMEAAWKENNCTVADFMAQKIIDDDQRLALLPGHLRLQLASKFHRIGKSMLEHGTNPADAVNWLQKAFALADPLEDNVALGAAELKISILQALARAYFVAGSYDRAEATLDELIPSIDCSPDHASAGYRELRWLRLAALKRRKAGDSALLDAFESIIDHMECSETNITDILQDLRTLHHQHTLVTAVHQHCLEKALASHSTGQDGINRLLLSLIFHCAKDEDHERALKTIDTVFTSLCQAEVELDVIPTTACLTLLWQYGDRHYHAKKWSEAADWFLAGSHELFRTTAPTASAKCFRKAALCYIEHREYARASTMIRRCPTNEAKTHYVMFLIAVLQAHEIRSETCLCVNSILSKIPLGTLMLHPHPRHDVQSFQCSKLEGFVREFAFQCQLPTRQLFSVEAWGDGLQDLRLRIFLLLPNVVLLALPFHDDSIILCLYLPPLLLILATVSSACHSSDSLVAGGRHRLHVLARFVEFEPLAIRVPLRYRRWCELRMAEDLSVHRACDVCLMTRAWRGPRFNRARTQSS
ncbi:putative oxidation-reduction process [Lyophyllum shimeji]|uniref:Protein ZIP4 homolog n=1 Tax=Lyophyllum shimeji TaxID=47721 RepID=A0A9P3PIH1_LYOSH|nr:putative oxidation-reduction process [Lyophyllum shimeji]